MSLRNRLCVLALGVLLSLYWAYPQYQARWGIRPPPPPAPAAAPPQAVVPVVKAKRRVHRKPKSPVKAPESEKTVSRKKVRGERLREKGEALGGGSPEKE
jgi:hypothetical protein